MFIVLGLGNPGAKHSRNRHNAGFMALDMYAEKEGAVFQEKKIFYAETAQAGELLLAKSVTFMNESGRAAKALCGQYGDTLVVVHDEINVPLGTVKCSYDRGSGDHNGVQSVIDQLGHAKFFRIRIGVRPVHDELLPRIAPPDGFEKFLLSDFTPMEEEQLKQGIATAIEIISKLPHKTFDELMNEYN